MVLRSSLIAKKWSILLDAGHIIEIQDVDHAHEVHLIVRSSFARGVFSRASPLSCGDCLLVCCSYVCSSKVQDPQISSEIAATGSMHEDGQHTSHADFHPTCNLLPDSPGTDLVRQEVPLARLTLHRDSGRPAVSLRQVTCKLSTAKTWPIYESNRDLSEASFNQGL